VERGISFEHSPRLFEQVPCSQNTRRGPNPPEKSKFLLLIDVSVSAAFNELVVEPVQQKIRQPTTAEKMKEGKQPVCQVANSGPR